MAETEETEMDIYEVTVELRQTAIVAVEAPSRGEAFEKLKHPRDEEVRRLLTRKTFTGAEYTPIDIIAKDGTEESELTVEPE